MRTQSEPNERWIPPEPAVIAATLSEAGVHLVEPQSIGLLPRDDRFAALLPGGQMAWFPTNERGIRRLERERRVLGLIARHCAFVVPRIIYASETGWDVRALVAGDFAPLDVYARVKTDHAFARKVGEGLGSILAQLHETIPAEELKGDWLPARPSWPPPIAFAERRLPRVTDDQPLIARGLKLLERYEAARSTVTESVLAHTDLGFHNTVIDPVSGEVAGVFDFDSAAHCDRHQDFRFLLLDDDDETLLETAASPYELATGRNIDRDRVRLFNAACAVAFLAYRAGSEPDEAPAGRTLAEDLRWTSMALARADA